ncbi:MAG: hypothetical protein KBF37_10705 [Saprospiraceae bacterium]|jgi:hypothetical protein|nr:hypothetical protein [Saprospiraceae bacterium]MBP9210777.1 hypothetical protein [Saprospiraceae bacterium]MBV6473894.1 hypothetical protein [Saprospiraceae bacterium]
MSRRKPIGESPPSLLQKEHFLRETLSELLQTIPPDRSPSWGRMGPQHMVEHLEDAFRMANGKDVYTGIFTPDERLPKMQAFLRSDQDFKEMTKNILLPDEPLPLRLTDLRCAIAKLEKEIIDFFAFWEGHRSKTLRNPFFGDLDFELWVALLYKHCQHHLRQFAVLPRIAG